MNAALCTIFFLSGIAALLFETLWFRQAGLLLGNTVWASSLVTAAFMGGLAMGNVFALRRGPSLERPLLLYALLELLIAMTGLSLVVGMPWLVPALAPLLSLLQNEVALNAVRVASAFILLAVPSTAMGATLPVLARSLGARDQNFGRVLGRLYGWNTAGAVAGALVGEAFLIRALGVGRTAYVAAALDLVAALGAVLLDRRQSSLAPASLPSSKAPLARSAFRIAASTFLAGGLLLALEVVWLRFLLLFFFATTATFAGMLAIVLFGIAVGSVGAAAWLGRWPSHHRHAPLVALAAGIAVVASYALFDTALAPRGSGLRAGLGAALILSFPLMAPVCVASGLLFTLLGKALHDEAGEEAFAAGLLTFANTMGAMLGALAAGFVLLPIVGIERSLFVLAGGYALVAGLLPTLAAPRSERWLRGLAWGGFVLALGLFPFGLMNSRYVRRVAERWSKDGSRLAAAKEGLTETVFLFRQDVLGQPLAWRLVTNGMGMSATSYQAHRYMGLFVWLPAAVHPAPRTALLISYGLGTTARALTDTKELTAIDVVDVSADVLRMSHAVWPGSGADPLRDPRVSVHLEDGRFFLATSRRRYDLITGEPPPLKSAGIANLYSQQYFRLMRERLAEGGIATYWLPVNHLDGREALAVVKAFCGEFEDCSLWSGYGFEWMLVGTRGARGPVSDERFTQQWNDPVVSAHLRAAAVESPERLGATFLADAEVLRNLTAGVPALVDDVPYLLDESRLGPPASPLYFQLLNTRAARQRFADSKLIRRLWPAAWRGPTQGAFDAQVVLNRFACSSDPAVQTPGLTEVEAALTQSTPEAVVLWYLGSSMEEQLIAARVGTRQSGAPELFEIQGVGALARREYRTAEALFARAEPHAGDAARLRQWRILALGLAGDTAGAGRLLTGAGPILRRSGGYPGGWSWLADRFASARPSSN